MSGRYPAYRDSGVEWLGEVPEGWEVKKLLYSLRDAPCYGVLVPDNDPFGIPMVRINDLTAADLDRSQFNRISPALSAEYSRTLLNAGDVVLAVVGTLGVARTVDGILAGCNLSRAVARIQAGAGIAADFLVWVFGSPNFERFTDLVCVGAAQRVLNMGDLAGFILALPPLPEQRAIAAFLDRETAKIDALVAEQRRWIDLLREKRQAVISHAVTKGLNPNAPMKPSGIDWLGDVPEGWEVNKFARLIAISEGQVDPRYEPYSSMILIAPNHIESGTGRLSALETAVDQGAESGKYMFAEGAVIYSKIRPALAKVVVAPSAGLCSADMYPLTSRGQLRQDYLAWLLLSPGFTAWAVLESDRVAMPKINREKLNELHLPVPPKNEQKQIVDFIDTATTKFDALTSTAETAIALLQERRAALISAAVTGKIDVRASVSSETEPA